MKNLIVFSLLVLMHTALHAQDYKISFTGTGASTIVDSVMVENVNTGDTLALAGNQILHLVDNKTVVSHIDKFIGGSLKIYPNPLTESSTVEFAVPASGKAHVEIFDILGKKVVSTSNTINAGLHSFVIKGLDKGVYTIKVFSTNFARTGKFVSNSLIGAKPQIIYDGSQKLALNLENMKSTQVEVVMQYKNGDLLKITGKSGIYKTVLNDVPNQSKELNIPFIQCTDADGNNYSVVKIGKQVWTVENLKTTKYNDGTPIPNVTDIDEWARFKTSAYCNYNNLESNAKIYGRLYNWYAVNTGTLAPKGWHIPTDEDWTILENYLIANGNNFDGTKDKNKVAKSLCAKTNWELSSKVGTPGSAPEKNNNTGFTALPGGYRYSGVGLFYSIGKDGFWWSSTENDVYSAYGRNLYNSGNGLLRSGNYGKGGGFSVRLVKD